MIATARSVLDTGVMVEYIDLRGEYHDLARAVVDSILRGRIEAIVPHPVVAETHYVSARIYRRLGLDDWAERADKLVRWLCSIPTVAIKGEDLALAIEASRVKLEYGLALTDCYVLAASEIYGGRPIFREREAEMLSKIDALEEEFSVVFLEDYK